MGRQWDTDPGTPCPTAPGGSGTGPTADPLPQQDDVGGDMGLKQKPRASQTPACDMGRNRPRVLHFPCSLLETDIPV